MKHLFFFAAFCTLSFASSAQNSEALVAGAETDAPFENLGQLPATAALKSTAVTHPATGHSRSATAKTAGHRPGTKVQAKAPRAAEPTVYYCASGNTVKYHAAPDCRGLSRCGATVTATTLREAQQSMQPCKRCY